LPRRKNRKPGSLDVVAAFGENEDMKEAVKAYEALVAKNIRRVGNGECGAYLS
jgi:hypothetical protein